MSLSTDQMHEPEESARDSEGAVGSRNPEAIEANAELDKFLARLNGTPRKPVKLDAAAIITWAKSVGWTLDRWGHLRKANRRLKLSRIAVRLEVQTEYDWVRLRSGYYKDLRIENGHLAGLTR